ncbi:hypothetical protein PM082_024955 [Marasmius tenuissimus]|nr:hypothetical protein PM082_024955 [Marasmius tenuissimus]
MARTTERQDATHALFITYLTQRILEQQQEVSVDSDSSESLDSDQSNDSGSDDSSDEEVPTSHRLLKVLEALHAKRYNQDHRKIPKTKENLRLLLTEYKNNYPEIFRSYVRMTPHAFNKLLELIASHPVFSNDSNIPQMRVEEQLAIALYRFGHYGNAASTMKVAIWAGVGFGTVQLVTDRVMLACLDQSFREATIHQPDTAAKDKAKEWVEDQSCAAWCDGWLMVNGTLVPLYARPAHFGNSWYDRKSNYSMNVQLVSTPDLRIVDYSIGLPGSQHDSTAWSMTDIAQNPRKWLADGEWIWADTAYPLRHWCQAPYKA